MMVLNDIDAFIKSGNFHSAESLAMQAVLDDPDNLALRYRLASIYLRQNNLEEAEIQLQYSYERAPDQVANLATYATVLARLGKFEQALSIIKKYEEKADINARILYTKVDIFVRLLNWPMAKKYITQYREAFAESLAVELSACNIHIKLREFDEAQTLLEKLLKKNPDNARIKTMLKEVEVESIRYNNSLEHVNQSSNSNLTTYHDYLLNADIIREFQNERLSCEKYRETMQRFPDRIEPRIRLIEQHLAQGMFDEAASLWSAVLNDFPYHNSLLSLERATQSYSCEKQISELLSETSRKIQENVGNANGLKKIAIIGGSNSIMLKGWAPAFKESLQRLYDVSVNNFGLGGISSLYGLTIIKEKKLLEQYDLLIFEYTLNDVYFNSIDGYPEELIRSMTEELARSAAESRCKLLFLEFVPLSELDRHLKNESVVPSIYKKTAEKYNINYFSVTDYIKSENYSRPNMEQLYTDEMHYTSGFSHKLCNELIGSVFSKTLSTTTHAPTEDTSDPCDIKLDKIRLLKPDQVNINGNCREIYRETAIIRASFLNIDKTATVSFDLRPGESLLGLMINSTIATGYIKVQFGEDRLFIKNIYANRPSSDHEKPRIFLRQFSQILQAKETTRVIITPNVTEDDIKNLPVDVTAYPASTLCPLEQQELEFSGILIA
ncbi:tetratricopeptide repeat protein [Legionella sp. CNM-4043-24]|uniref:tetratricopeptide repeat protein n=1 Tax=Legionella sp. CNM-4043-24 TaxID=3421646 RepID=UPI00403AED43